VKLQDRWTRPFLVRFPRFPVSSPVVPSRRREGIPERFGPAGPERTDSTETGAIRPDQERAKEGNGNQGITTRERQLLLEIAEHPSRWSPKGMPASVDPPHGNEGQGNLTRAETHRTGTDRRSGRTVNLLRLTDLARDLLASRESRSRPSEEREPGARVLEEDHRRTLPRSGLRRARGGPHRGGKAIDLVATKGDERIAIEVETGKSYAEGNVRKCGEAGFARVVTIYTDRNASLPTPTHPPNTPTPTEKESHQPL